MGRARRGMYIRSSRRALRSCGCSRPSPWSLKRLLRSSWPARRACCGSRDGLCVAASASGVIGRRPRGATARGVATTRGRGSSSQGVALAHAGRSLDVDSAAGLEYARRVDSTAQARAKSMPAGRALAIDRRAAAQATRARCRKSIIATWSVVAIFEAPSAPRRPPPRRAARIDMCVGRSAPRVVSPVFMALLSRQKESLTGTNEGPERAQNSRGSARL